jgi:hypothetical protein
VLLFFCSRCLAQRRRKKALRICKTEWCVEHFCLDCDIHDGYCERCYRANQTELPSR